MQTFATLPETHPNPQGLGPDRVRELAPALADCALTCRACADACLAEEMVKKLRHCITTDLACAEITQTLANQLVRQTAPDVNLLRPLAQACEAACRACAQECEQHAEMHEHCKRCGEICRECERVCQQIQELL